MDLEKQKPGSPEKTPLHVRTREEVMEMQAVEARTENMRRLAERLGGVSLENTPNQADAEPLDSTEEGIGER